MEFHFILSHPAVAENIGAAARALKTMGFSSLRLVSPASHLSTDARKLAHGSNDILEKARVYDTTAEAIADLDFIIGTTSKKRNIRQEYIPVRELSAFLQNKSGTVTTVGILFGSEESGLSNEEIQRCDILSYIPLATSFPSLNLAQAVMLFAYELSGLHTQPQIHSQPAKESSYKILKDKTKELLSLLGIHEARPIYHRIFERLALTKETDIHLLLSVTEAMIKKQSGRKKNS